MNIVEVKHDKKICPNFPPLHLPDKIGQIQTIFIPCQKEKCIAFFEGKCKIYEEITHKPTCMGSENQKKER
ncbi:MAG: hypothetical protein QW474_01190 [Candidatus Aenigmatarchaeota archaeon]